jgi:hypothetical protein
LISDCYYYNLRDSTFHSFKDDISRQPKKLAARILSR